MSKPSGCRRAPVRGRGNRWRGHGFQIFALQEIDVQAHSLHSGKRRRARRAPHEQRHPSTRGLDAYTIRAGWEELAVTDPAKAPRAKFTVRKLEERIAPKIVKVNGGGNTPNGNANGVPSQNPAGHEPPGHNR